MAEFFSFDDARKKVNAQPLAEGLNHIVGGTSSQEAMDKSILLYTHILKGVKEYNPEQTEDLVSLLSSCKGIKDKEIARAEAEFFVRSLQDDDLWRQVADFYWSFCVIQYKVMTELKLLTNLDHLEFNTDGTMKGVRNIYGNANKNGKPLLGISLATLVIAYFYDHLTDYQETIRLVRMNANLDDEVDSHMASWGHCLLAYLSIVMYGGGVVNYKKFVDFCSDYSIGPDTSYLDLYIQAIEAFDIKQGG